ncbi:MAG: hypothetical protein RR303_09705 [Bacteroidales bacterium]
MEAKKKLVLVRNSVDGKGLELAETLLKEGIRVMINGPEQEKIIEKLNQLAKTYNACQLYGVPGNIMSVEEFNKFYGNPQIDEIVSA